AGRMKSRRELAARSIKSRCERAARGVDSRSELAAGAIKLRCELAAHGLKFRCDALQQPAFLFRRSALRGIKLTAKVLGDFGSQRGKILTLYAANPELQTAPPCAYDADDLHHPFRQLASPPSLRFFRCERQATTFADQPINVETPDDRIGRIGPP